MRNYRVIVDVKDPRDRHTRASVEAEVQQAVAGHARSLVLVKASAELITPSQAGEKKNVNTTKV